MTTKNAALVSALVASVLNLPDGAVGADASMESISKWDSLAHLNICLAFQERFGVEFDMETITNSTSVAKLANAASELILLWHRSDTGKLRFVEVRRQLACRT